MSIVYKGVGGEGGGGRAGGFRNHETQAATVGLDHSRGQGGCWG